MAATSSIAFSTLYGTCTRGVTFISGTLLCCEMNHSNAIDAGDTGVLGIHSTIRDARGHITRLPCTGRVVSSIHGFTIRGLYFNFLDCSISFALPRIGRFCRCVRSHFNSSLLTNLRTSRLASGHLFPLCRDVGGRACSRVFGVGSEGVAISFAACPRHVPCIFDIVSSVTTRAIPTSSIILGLTRYRFPNERTRLPRGLEREVTGKLIHVG